MAWDCPEEHRGPEGPRKAEPYRWQRIRCSWPSVSHHAGFDGMGSGSGLGEGALGEGQFGVAAFAVEVAAVEVERA